MTPVLTFFNNQGGIGKTSLIYHLAWTYADQGKRVVAVDLDPQAKLTAAFLDEDQIEELWNDHAAGATIDQCVRPLLTGKGDMTPPELQRIATGLYLLPGDAALSSAEDMLFAAWFDSLDKGNDQAMPVLSAFWKTIQIAAKNAKADLILVDIGPNLGAINRSALLATDYIVIPLGADLFSQRSLRSLGPEMRRWKRGWAKRLDIWRSGDVRHLDLALPKGDMRPIGYLYQRHSAWAGSSIHTDDKWVQRIPAIYREAVLAEPSIPGMRQQDDPCCLATIKHYRSLIPMAQERRKPIFKLSSADGAIGSHAGAVRDAKLDFQQLADRIAQQMTD